MFRVAALLSALAGAVLVAACGDPLRVNAQFPVLTDTLRVFALSGTPLTAPTALQLLTLNVTEARAVAGGGQLDVLFDVAFDIDENGQVLLYPPSLVAISPRTVGFQDVDESFAELLFAPSRGYRRDSVFVAAVGETVVVEAQVSICSQFSPVMYAKLVVDSVKADVRAIFFRAAVDPNCGFRSFAEGVPED
ncbi:MAG: hypothetical protein ACRENI_15060 [Gemmatimonadaceae bacterium]